MDEEDDNVLINDDDDLGINTYICATNANICVIDAYICVFDFVIKNNSNLYIILFKIIEKIFNSIPKYGM